MYFDIFVTAVPGAESMDDSDDDDSASEEEGIMLFDVMNFLDIVIYICKLYFSSFFAVLLYVFM